MSVEGSRWWCRRSMHDEAEKAMKNFRQTRPECFTNGWFTYPDDSPEAKLYLKWINQLLDNLVWKGYPDNPMPPCIDVFTEEEEE